MCDEEPMQTPKLKITNENEIHHGYQYHDGLNVLQEPFQNEGSCVPGGFYYTDKENLHHFYNYGIWIRCIDVPSDALIVKDPDESGGVKWRCNKIIFLQKYPLYDLNTIKTLDLHINETYIKNACVYGKLDILEWWCKSCQNPEKYLDELMNLASQFNHVHILDLLKNSGLPLKYNEDALDIASENGHINVLEWWLKSGLPLKYNEYALDYASGNGHINVLTWWLKSGLELKYSESALNSASWKGHVNVLEWWLKSCLPLKYDKYALSNASMNGHINVLEWWKNSGLPLEYDEYVLNKASQNGYINVLEWWKNSGLEFKYNERVLINTYWSNQIDALEWFINNNFEVPLWYKFVVYYNTIKKKVKSYIGL
jgi:ankyrin repeat protein